MEFELSNTIKILERTPGLINDLLNGLPEELVHNNEGPGTWSPFDIVGHFIHGEKTDWIPRAKIILSGESDKPFIPFDRFAQFENSKGKSIDDLISEFSSLRTENIEILKSFNLNETKLVLTGIHPDFGKVNLRQLLSTWTVHDLVHINQMTRVLASNYKGAIGPWRKYIKLLN